MKKSLLILLALSLILGLATLLWAREGGTPGIYGTPHDVQVITGEAGLEPCAMCHSPHSGTGQYPLWNRDQGPQSYTMYSSPTYDMGAVSASSPQEPSSLCLVCHNGIFSSLVNYPGPGSHTNENYDYEMNPTFWAMLDTDLRNEHPISFTYDPSLDANQDNNNFPPAEQCSAETPWRYWIPGQEGRLTYPLYRKSSLSSGNTTEFECSTCHSVHDTVLYPGKQMVGGKSVGTQVFFLRASNAGSLMCADCHRNRY
jgi:hypothetical protein